MSRRLSWSFAVSAVIGLVAAPAPGQEKNPAEETALMKQAEAFVDAFHKGDAKALAAHWTPDGDYTDQTGKTLKGRAAIEKAFASLFAEHKGLKARIDITSVRFVTPDVAIEDGISSVLPPDGGPPSRARYTNVHVKRNDQWQLSSVRESPFAVPNNREHLAELEWLIGPWATGNEKGEVARVAYDWGENQNYLIGEFTNTFKHFAIGGGTQRIGWDAGNKQIRSWVFENNGTFGGGTWKRDGNQWTIKATTTLNDGKQMTATHVLTRVDADTMSMEFRDRTVDGQAVPEVKTITLRRVAANGPTAK
jgi:uncharacterized protein (TIGR02246 family)